MQLTPYTITFAGSELEVFPHRARMTKPDSYGHRPVTVGGIVIGYWAKLSCGNYYGYNTDHTFAAITTDKLGKCAELLATRDVARDAYRTASFEGAFGTEAERIERERMDQVIADLDDQAELVEVEVPDLDFTVLDTLSAPRAGRGSNFAQTRLLYTATGEFIGTLVQEPYFDFVTPVWAAHTLAGRRTQGMGYSEAKQVLANLHKAAQDPQEPEDTYAWSDVCHEPSGVSRPRGLECSAPLMASGVCPASRSHLAVMARNDRDRHLDEAARALGSAVSEQFTMHNGEGDVVLVMIKGMQDQINRLRDSLAETGD